MTSRLTLIIHGETVCVSGENIVVEIKNEPAAAVDTAGDYLREPTATVSGQILREGDAPRETGRPHGGVASCPDANSNSRPSLSEVAERMLTGRHGE